MEEIWKDVVGYEGLYEVSSLGRIKSLDRRCKRRADGTTRNVRGCILKQAIRTGGYNLVTLCNKGHRKNASVHRVVAEAFHANPRALPFVNHKDGNKLNNVHTNLEWVSCKENVQHAIKTGLVNRNGTNNNIAKLNDEVVLNIRALYEQGLRQRDIDRMYGLNYGHTHQIVHRKTWKHI